MGRPISLSVLVDDWLFDICGLMVMVLLLKVTLGLIIGLLATTSG